MLIELGYRLRLCAGNLTDQVGILIPELSLHDEEVCLIQRNLFVALCKYADEAELQERIYQMTGVIEKKNADVHRW